MDNFQDEGLEEKSQQPKERENIQEQVSSGAVETLSEDEVQNLLDKYDGFEELLAPLADNLKVFSAGADRKKRRFLQDEDTVDERQELKDCLSAFLGFINQDSVSDHKSIRTIAQEKLDKNEDLINENLDNILNASKDIEQTYRELETFFRNAEPQKTKNLTLLNVHPEALLDADSSLVYNAVEKLLMDEALSVDQRKAYSMLVIPSLWKSKRPKDLIERYSKLAGNARLSFLTDFADCESAEDAQDIFESKKWQGVTGPESFHSKLILFANHMIMRGKHEGMDKDEDMKGSVAMAVAGKMYKEKISQPIMGEMNGSLSNSQGLSFRTSQPEVTDLGNLGMNSTMHAYDKDMVYNKCTAFDGAEKPLKDYAVVRTFDYVNRVLRHYLGKVTGQQLDRSKANFTRETIQDFLNQLTEQKIISAGKVSKFEWNPKEPDRIDVQVDIQPLWAVKTFVYALKAKDRNVDIDG